MPQQASPVRALATPWPLAAAQPAHPLACPPCPPTPRCGHASRTRGGAARCRSAAWRDGSSASRHQRQPAWARRAAGVPLPAGQPSTALRLLTTAALGCCVSQASKRKSGEEMICGSRGRAGRGRGIVGWKEEPSRPPLLTPSVDHQQASASHHTTAAHCCSSAWPHPQHRAGRVVRKKLPPVEAAHEWGAGHCGDRQMRWRVKGGNTAIHSIVLIPPGGAQVPHRRQRLAGTTFNSLNRSPLPARAWSSRSRTTTRPSTSSRLLQVERAAGRWVADTSHQACFEGKAPRQLLARPVGQVAWIDGACLTCPV